MSKKLFFICCFTISSIAAFAQAPVDLFDPFYEDLTLWENIGLINDAPAIRPYPLQEIKRLLNIVIEKGDAGQRRRAEEYQARFFSRVFHYGGGADYKFVFQNNQKQNQLMLTPLMKMNYQIADILTVSANVSFSLFNKLDNKSLLPVYTYTQKDIAEDAGTYIGSFRSLPLFNFSAAVGTPEYYLSGGLARASYGPFHDSSIFISRDAFHAGQFIFTVNKEKWGYNQVLLFLSAVNEFGGYMAPNKFLASHSLDIRPFPWLSFSVIDTMMYGGRFEPIYLLPFSVFFLGQSIYGFPDNSLIGFSTTVKPVKGLRFDTAFYVDDIGLSRIVKFQEALWRMSGQIGLSYTMPKTHWFSCIELGYTFVMPYMYTHVDNDDQQKPNYQNYTHYGQPLGNNLPPNSDRFQIKLKFRPIYGLDINVSNNFIRHANTTEGITDVEMLKDYLGKEYRTDGSVFNHPTVTDLYPNGDVHWKNHAFLYSTPFMKQQTIQYVNQLGLDISCHLPIKKSGGHMLFKFGYVFEADINPGVGRNIYKPNATTKGWHEKKIGSGTDQVSENQIKTEAANQLTAWRNAAVGKNFNHYIKLSAEFAY